MGRIINELKEKNLKNQQLRIQQAVVDGDAEYNFSRIKSTYKDNTAYFNVFEDALKIEGVRVNVSAESEQIIANQLGCLLMTAKIADLRFAQADTVIEPRPRPISSSVKAMVEHSLDIDKQLEGVSEPGIVATVGKHWIIDNKLLNPRMPGMALNYGWHFKGNSFQGIKGGLPVSYKEMPGVRMIQTIGTHHSLHHQDYSQICVLVDRNCMVNNKAMDLVEVLKDPELYHLACHNRPLKVWYQPGAPNPEYEFIPTEPIIV